ncbi:MAG: azurin [Pseudomonadota bacterium]
MKRMNQSLKNWTVLAFALSLAACGGSESTDTAESTIESAADTVTETVDDAVDTATEAADGAVDAASDMMDDAADAVADAVDETVDAADDAMDAAHSTMDSAADAVDDAAGALAGAAAAPPADDGDPCTLNITAGDNIAYSTNELSVPSSCTNVTVTLTHTGNLPKIAMGHNWVLAAAGDADAVAAAGTGAGVDGNYLPAGDERIIAATELVGGGESSSVTFALSKLKSGTDYVYVCSFPGHWTIMKGTFTVTG